MFVQRLILADETVLENCGCGYGDRSVLCMLHGIPFAQAFQYFSGPEKFNKIIFEMEEDYFITRIEYSGIERIVSITQRNDDVEVYLEGYRIEKKETKIHKDVSGSIPKDAVPVKPFPN